MYHFRIRDQALGRTNWVGLPDFPEHPNGLGGSKSRGQESPSQVPGHQVIWKTTNRMNQSHQGVTRGHPQLYIGGQGLESMANAKLRHTSTTYTTF